MQPEQVGQCQICKTNIYCRDGFLDGVVGDDKHLYCHHCYAKQNKSPTIRKL